MQPAEETPEVHFVLVFKAVLDHLSSRRSSASPNPFNTLVCSAQSMLGRSWVALNNFPNSSFLEPNTDKLVRWSQSGADKGFLVGGGLVQLFNSLRVGFDRDCLQRFVHRILGECLEEARVGGYSTRTDALSCVLGSGIKETAGLLLGGERRRGKQTTLSVIDFFPGEEKEGLALRARSEVALTYELMELCISEYIPHKFPSGNVKIVGWYHSHPREVTLYDMSTVDKETQRAYQGMYENAVCLIVKIELLGRAWLKALTNSYVLMDEIRRAIRFYRVSNHNKVVPIEWDFQRHGVRFSPQTHVHSSWFSPSLG